MLPFKCKTILIMTALPLERDAIMRFLNRRGEVTTQAGSTYEKCSFEQLDVYVGLSGAGNLNAGPEAERALATLRPDVAIFTGIAGGVKDVSLGDVVVANKLYSYETGVDTEQFKPRPEIGLPSYRLVQITQGLARAGTWRAHIPLPSSREPTVFVGAIAAGEKVIKSSTGAVATLLKQTFSDTLALEMEGAAFLKATYHNRVDALVIRGISDLLDGKAAADKSGSQEIAAMHAAAFTEALLVALNQVLLGQAPPSPAGADPVTFWVRFRELASRLYPMGPRENDIWRTAGGDLSRLDLSDTGYTQWARALRKLEQGGGGDITPQKLLAAMLQEFSNNADLVYLYEVAVKGS
ncbi:MAG TPA: hypothetical protein VI653_28620 [Steroidobacteraceae bacterium]